MYNLFSVLFSDSSWGTKIVSPEKPGASLFFFFLEWKDCIPVQFDELFLLCKKYILSIKNNKKVQSIGGSGCALSWCGKFT